MKRIVIELIHSSKLINFNHKIETFYTLNFISRKTMEDQYYLLFDCVENIISNSRNNKFNLNLTISSKFLSKYVEYIVDVHIHIFNECKHSVLEKLNRLKYLTIDHESNCQKYLTLDLSNHTFRNITNIKYLKIHNISSIKNINIFTKLESLDVYDYCSQESLKLMLSTIEHWKIRVNNINIIKLINLTNLSFNMPYISNIETLTNLKRLCGVFEPFPYELMNNSGLSKIEHLELTFQNNHNTELIFFNPSMTYLKLVELNLYQKIGIKILHLTRLEKLHLERINIFHSLCNFHSLKYLKLSNVYISGIEDNVVQNASIAILHRLTNLEYLCICETDLVELCHLIKLTYLELNSVDYIIIGKGVVNVNTMVWNDVQTMANFSNLKELKTLIRKSNDGINMIITNYEELKKLSSVSNRNVIDLCQ